MPTKLETQVEHDMIVLASLIDGLYVLQDQAATKDDTLLSRSARDGLPALLEVTSEKAWALQRKIELMGMKKQG